MEPTLKKIYNASLKFLMPLTIEESYQLIVEEALKFVDGDFGSILLEEKDELKRVYASDPIMYTIKPRKRGYMYSVFKTRKPLILTYKAIEKVHPQIKKINARSDISVSISYKNKSIGVLTIMSMKKVFNKEELNILRFFGPMASLAIRKAQLNNEIKVTLENRELFLSLAAHELRTPLTSINGYVQFLKSKLGNSKKVESRWVEELSWEVHRLTKMVSELLQVNRIKSGQLHYDFKICNLNEIIKRAISTFQFNYPNNYIRFHNQTDGVDKVVGDFDKLLQVCTNLLDNAAKFSPEDGKIVIDLKKRGVYLVLTVKDWGVGIPKKDLDKIFEGFYKGPAAHTKKGMGLGLFLVKNILEEHHGFINVSSKENEWSLFEVRLPKAKL